jgi:hypothetical protein
VTIGNGGDISGAFTLAKAGVQDSSPNGGVLSQQLDLLVQDVTSGTPTTVYSGKLGAMPDQALGTFAAGSTRTYQFTVTVPDLGNTFQGASTSVTYNWSASSSSTTTAASAGGGGGGGGTTITPGPLSGVTLAGTARQNPFKHHGNVLVTLNCAAPCDLTAGGTLSIPNGAAKTYPFGKVRRALSRAGHTVLTLKIPKKAVNPLKKAIAKKRFGIATVKVTGKVGGEPTSAQRTIVLRK